MTEEQTTNTNINADTSNSKNSNVETEKKDPEKLTILGLFNPAKGRASLMRLIVLIGIIAVIIAIAVSPALRPAPAAIVNGQRIEEKTITDYITDYREKYKYTDDEKWAECLISFDKTVEDFRKDIIDYFVGELLLNEGAKEKGVVVDSASVEELYNSVRNQYSDEQTWQDALSQAGLTEESYKKQLNSVSLQQKFGEKLREERDDNSELDKEKLDTVNSCLEDLNGAKKSSHILFKSDNEEDARYVLEEINAGRLSFENAVEQYSTDDASKVDGGNVGWDKTNNFIEAYKNALANLEKDQISDLVKTDYGIHIIKCTDVFNASEDLTSLDQVPEDLIENIVKSAEQQYDYQLVKEWTDDKKASADIQIFDMPSGLPYYIDVEQYKDKDSNSDDSSSDTSSSESTESVDASSTDATADNISSDGETASVESEAATKE